MSSPQSAFNPDAFLDVQQNEVNTKRPPLPVMNPASPDGFYTAVIGATKTDSGTIEKGEKTGRPWMAVLVPLVIQVPPQVQDLLSLKLEKGTITLTDRVFIDLTEQNTIDNSSGRNRRQRLYREALNLNKPGDIWSWRKAEGQPIKIKIDQEIYEGEIQERIGTLLKV